MSRLLTLYQNIKYLARRYNILSIDTSDKYIIPDLNNNLPRDKPNSNIREKKDFKFKF